MNQNCTSSVQASAHIAQRPSLRPQIDVIVENSSFVLGTGMPGGVIRVVYPDGSGVCTTVNENGIWMAAVPSGIPLNAGDVVEAAQTVDGALSSPPVTRVVVSVSV